MHQHKFVMTFLKNTTIHNPQLDQIWNNPILITCQSRNTCKLIEMIINQYILHSNYQTMYLAYISLKNKNVKDR